MKIKLFILILISLPIYSFINDRPLNQYVIKNWTRSEGLPQNSILTSKLTRDGYIWIGTEEGLVRFDGVNFKVFDKYKLKTSHHHILDIQEDPIRPFLWVVTSSNGLLLFNYKNFSVKKFTPLTKDNTFINIDRIKFSSKNILWIGTRTEGICRFNTDSEKVEKCFNKETGLINNKVTFLNILEDGNPIIVTNRSNILKFNGKDFESITHNLPIGIGITNLKLDKKGYLWITTYSGVFRLKDNKLSSIIPEVFDKIPTNFIYEDSSGTFWVVSKEQGIFRLNKDFTAVDRLKLRVPIEIREDKYDNLWVSTLGAGLFRLSLGVMRSYTKENGLTGAPVYPIFQRQDGTILFGSFGSGVLEFKDEKISQYKTIDGKSVTRSVTSIIETKSKELWFYLYGKGLVNIKGDKVIKAFKSENGLPSNTGMTLLEDRENNIWGSTVRGDLFKIDSNHNIKVYSSNEKLDLNTISSITEDSKGNKWIATAKGVAIFDGLEFTSFKPKLIFSRVLSISHYDKMVIITGYQGIFILKGDKVHHINHNYGLYANTVFASVIDDFGRLWFTSNNGVFSIDSTELDKFIKNNEKPKIRSYSIEDGLSSIECAGGSQFNLIKDKKGQIWFPTVNGVSVIDPKNLLAPPQKPFVKFKTILFDNKKESLENKKEIFIEPRVKWITIPINSITHHISKKIKYRYRLKNYDEQWLSLENNEVRISALPSGKYTLELSATDSMGNWLKPITIKLNFIPHFYEKPIFFIVLTPFIILLILFYIKLRTRRIVLKNQELEDLIAERTEKIKELSLSDPLTVLRNRRFVDEIIKPKLCQYFSQKEYDLSNADNRVQASNNSGYAIFLLDIDHFKNVNDVYGHDAGDCVLIQFARLLKENVRKDDFIIRWGGEEFLIILSNTKFESLDKFASKLKEKIENYEFDLGEGKKIFKTASAGYLYFPFIPSSPLFLKFEDGVKLADQGLYYAKENGRNKFVGFKFNKVIPDIEDLPVLLKDVDKGVEKEFFNMEVID